MPIPSIDISCSEIRKMALGTGLQYICPYRLLIYLAAKC